MADLRDTGFPCTGAGYASDIGEGYSPLNWQPCASPVNSIVRMVAAPTLPWHRSRRIDARFGLSRG